MWALGSGHWVAAGFLAYEKEQAKATARIGGRSQSGSEKFARTGRNCRQCPGQSRRANAKLRRTVDDAAKVKASGAPEGGLEPQPGRFGCERSRVHGKRHGELPSDAAASYSERIPRIASCCMLGQFDQSSIIRLREAAHIIVRGDRVDWTLAEGLLSLHWIIRDPIRQSGFRLTDQGLRVVAPARC